MRTALLVGLVLLALAAAQTPTYIVGPMGWSCADACHAKGLNCNPRIVTNNSPAQFASLGIKCTPDPAPWYLHLFDSALRRSRWAEDQPSYVSNTSDPNYGYEFYR